MWDFAAKVFDWITQGRSVVELWRAYWQWVVFPVLILLMLFIATMYNTIDKLEKEIKIQKTTIDAQQKTIDSKNEIIKDLQTRWEQLGAPPSTGEQSEGKRTLSQQEIDGSNKGIYQGSGAKDSSDTSALAAPTK